MAETHVAHKIISAFRHGLLAAPLEQFPLTPAEVKWPLTHFFSIFHFRIIDVCSVVDFNRRKNKIITSKIGNNATMSEMVDEMKWIENTK